TGRYSLSSASETRNGSRVCDATSSGPAEIASPSPMLLTTVADSSQRKLRPSRGGAMASTMDLAGDGTRGRIAACHAAAKPDRSANLLAASRCGHAGPDDAFRLARIV